MVCWVLHPLLWPWLCFCCGTLSEQQQQLSLCPHRGAEGSLSLADHSQAAVLAEAEPFRSEIGLLIHCACVFSTVYIFVAALVFFSHLCTIIDSCFSYCFSHSFCFSDQCLFYTLQKF